MRDHLPGVAVSGMLRPRVQLSGFSSSSTGGATPGPLSVPEKHGMDIIRDPSLNKGMATTLKERQSLGIHGLLPPNFITQDDQVERCMRHLSAKPNDLEKYIYLCSLQDRNERLFFRLLKDHLEELMPIIYTPTVGLACQKYGLLFRRPRGLFITIHDKGHIYDILKNWPVKNVKAVCFTDGERILGLGDQGCQGMGIPVGKLALYTGCAAINPQYCLPVTLDVGTNNQALLDDPMYIGLRHKRVTGAAYDEFIEEFISACKARYGSSVLMHFEDFGNQNAFRLLSKYLNNTCCFNDDIQGTASVALAGILGSLRITQNKISDHTFVFLGAGEANLGIAELICLKMEKEGVPKAEAYKKIFMMDSRGLLVTSRTNLSEHKIPFAKDMPACTSLEEVVKTVKPSALIGAAAQPKTFTKEIIEEMSRNNERPIIFALSNPTSKSECSAEEAYKWSNNKAVFASGSPFPKYEQNGVVFEPGQGNNAYIFPAVALGVMCCGSVSIPDELFLQAAEALSHLVSEKDLEVGRVYPRLSDIQATSVKIAVSVIERAYELNLATVFPKPANLEQFVLDQLYDTEYPTFIPDTYEYDISSHQ
ncbi:hypothetical protein ACHWQZ_G005286 [Mnemiopsis leidyi]